jgi:hypothetical protein
MPWHNNNDISISPYFFRWESLFGNQLPGILGTGRPIPGNGPGQAHFPAILQA